VLDALERAGKSVAVVSSSANAVQVLGAVALADRFALIVDGVVAEAEGLPGKPAPDTYLFAARVLSATPDRAVVVEDAVAGVQAGRAGGFGLVVGVDRGTGAQALRDAGADMVITTLTQLLNPLPLKS
jgi:HAD superfamily hydrolase (TIGR01509 family)